ncbi:MAG: response regulator [Acidobacteria bacterium]|nr:response regulator [Acidobacteriota bacterium]
MAALDGTDGAAPLRVLICDDEPDVRLMLRLQLETHGYEVAGEASDGLEALELCAANEPDVAVVDLMMPRMNGYEAIPRLRADHPDVAVIAFTAVVGDNVRREMARLKVPVVLKTGNFAPLHTAIRSAADGDG